MAGEAAQLSLEYNEMHKNIQVNDTHTYLPECWAGLVPLKAELYKGESRRHCVVRPSQIPIPNVSIAALAHHYESRSIDASVGDGDNISLGTKKSQTVSSNESFIGNAREALRANEAASAASDCDGEESVSAVAIKRTHLKEALASHEEAQRLQRMCRYLKVSQLHENFC